MHEVECTKSPSRKMKGTQNKSTSEDAQEENSPLNKLDNKERCNDLGPYGDDSSDDQRSSSSLNSTESDSDTDTLPGTESEDDIDLELLHGLQEIHISTQRPAAAEKNELLVPKGPQKTHKIRKQNKTASGPYQQQQSTSGGRHSDYPPGECVGPPQYAAEDRVDMVLSESLNDPGFRNNLMYTLEAEVEQSYPKLITPPLSSSDCPYAADYTPGFASSNQHSYYHQYTPESLHTASPQGSDVSLDDDHYQTQGKAYHQQFNSSQDSLSSHLTPPTSNSPPLSDDFSEPREHYHNEDDMACRDSNQRSPDSSTAGDRPLSNAEKFIDNMCTGVKYFLASGKRHPGEVIDSYQISEDRAQSLLALARVIGSKLDTLKDTEKRLSMNCVSDANTFTVYEYLS